VFGTAQRDGPLIVLGATGMISALLMLHRARATAPRPVAGTDPVARDACRVDNARTGASR
jgi:hypothetical protein